MSGHRCYHCKQWVEEGEAHDCWTTTETALTADLSEDLQEAWERLRETAAEFGDQRIYASHKSIMFARESCYFFVRPKRTFLELCVFLGRTVDAPQVRRVDRVSKSKLRHTIPVRHRDEVEPPITDWLAEAYELYAYQVTYRYSGADAVGVAPGGEAMARSEPKGVGRREFLKETAAGAAGMAGGAEAAGAAGQHDHDHQVVPDDIALRVRALESILVEKEMIDPADLDAVVDAYENRIGPRNGAQIVARAWTDPEYRARLLADGTAAIAEFGFTGAQGEHMVVVENTPEVHNLVVCTLCSCYPWPTLGLPPVWYKSAAYRSRAVIEPRAVLRDFGTELPDDVEVRVWDSTAEIRYLVLPERPAGTQELGEAALAELVSRDSMIGVARVAAP